MTSVAGGIQDKQTHKQTKGFPRRIKKLSRTIFELSVYTHKQECMSFYASTSTLTGGEVI